MGHEGGVDHATARLVSLARQEGVLLSERADMAGRLRRAPDPLVPAHPHRHSEPGDVRGLVDSAALPHGDHAAAWAAAHVAVGPQGQDQPLRLAVHIGDVHPGTSSRASAGRPRQRPIEQKTQPIASRIN